MKTYQRIVVRISVGVAILSLAGTAHAGSSAYRNVVLADNPIVYYEFDEVSGTTADNSATTGATYDGTFNTAGGSVTVGQPSFAQGGTAYDFGGGRVTAAAFSTLTEWTVEAWINWDSAKTSQSHIFGNDQAGWNDDVLFGIGTEDGIRGVPASNVGCIQQSADQSTTRDVVTEPLSHSEWHHVVATGSDAAGVLKLYVDGVLVDTDDSLTLDTTMNGHQFAVGSDGHYDRAFDGLIDEFALYDTALDATTINDHYEAGLGYRDTVLADSPIIYYEFNEISGTTAFNSGSLGSSHNGTIVGTVSLNESSFAQGGTAYDFGGGRVTAAAFSTLTEWTVEAWINWDSAKDSASNIFGQDQGGWNDDVLFGIRPEGGIAGVPAGHLGVSQQSAGQSTTRDVASDSLSHSVWHHVVATGSDTAGELKLYVDGVQVDIDSSLTRDATMNGYPFAVGAARFVDDAGTRPFDGLIDEFALYDAVLDATTIAAHCDAGSGTIIEFNGMSGDNNADVPSDFASNLDSSISGATVFGRGTPDVGGRRRQT